MSECSAHSSVEFERFLVTLKHLLGDEVASHTQSLTITSWDSHCRMQRQLDDARFHSICVAAAFTIIPFPLTSTSAMLLTHNPMQKPISPIPAEGLVLVVASVVSNYGSVTSSTVESACFNNISIHVLGVGVKQMYRHGLGKKILLLRDFVNGLTSTARSNGTVVLFLDGLDTIIQGGSAEILRRFVETGSRILFSAEHACYPFKYWPMNLNLGPWLGPCRGACSNARYICDNLFPTPRVNPLDPTNRWLNSGAFIGYLDDVRRMLEAAGRIPVDILARWPGYDQGLYTHMLLSRQWNMDVDVNSTLFFSFGIVADRAEAVRGRPRSPLALVPAAAPPTKGGRSRRTSSTQWATWYNRSHVPLVLHFNGDGKSSGALARVLRLSQPKRERGAAGARGGIGDSECSKRVFVHHDE